MAYVVDRVVICDASQEPGKHYEILPGGRSRLLEWWFERDEERAAIAKRLFFCPRVPIETVIYLYSDQTFDPTIEISPRKIMRAQEETQ